MITSNTHRWIMLSSFALAMFCSAQAAGQSFKVAASGLEYRIIQKGKGEKIEKSNRVFLQYLTRLNQDTAIFDASTPMRPYAFIVGESEGLKGWDEALLMLHVGDSAIFRIPPHMAYGSRKVGRIPANSFLQFSVRVKGQEEAYFDLAGKTPLKLDSGLLKYQVKKTEGRPVQAFCQLTMHFTGYIKDENGNRRIFQSSLTNSAKAIFQLGSGRMVKGLDQGLATMKVGEKATFEIAPYLAFGQEKNGIIPANSTLYFDIEVQDCSDPFFHTSRTDTIYGFNHLKVLKLKDSIGRHISADEVVKLHCVTYFLDSLGHKILLSSTYDSKMPIVVRAGSKMKMMGLNLGLTYLRNGESATIIVPAKPEYSSVAGDQHIKQFCHDVTILEVIDYPFYDGSAKDTVITATGLKYLVIRKGEGASLGSEGEVSTAYTGYVITSDGRKQIFDASRESGRLLNFELGKHQVIAGFEEGIAGMSAGEARKIIIPSNLGYGEKGVPDAGIPANSTLYFDVELIQFKSINEKLHD